MPGEDAPPAAGPPPAAEGPAAPSAPGLPRLLERLAVAVLLLAALLPRARDLDGPFDREFEGWQGAFFAIAAVNYERLGLGALGGYPVLNVDLPRTTGTDGAVWDHPDAWYAYTNHPPLVPLVAWWSLALLGPAGWDEAWRRDEAPVGVEAPLRLPFLLASLAALAALWWALRESRGTRAGLIALALAAVAPPWVVYAPLVNYENPGLVCVLVAAAGYARWMRGGRRVDLGLMALGFAAGSLVTWAPLLFLPGFVLAALAAGGPRRAAAVAGAGGVAGLVPLMVHAAFARSALEGIGREPEGVLARGRTLIEPLLDGSAPFGEWFGLQIARLWDLYTPGLALVAAAGLVVLIVSRRAAVERERGPVDVALPLLAGGWLVLLAFYRHSFDAQLTFQMWLGPGLLALAATALDTLAPRLERLRGGLAPLVVAVSLVGLPCVLRASAWRHEVRAPLGAEAPGLGAPVVPLPDETGAEFAQLLPAGSLGLHPSELGLGLAVSFYAWRSLWPITGPEDASGFDAAESFGLAEAPVLVLLPLEAPPGARAQVEALEKKAVEIGEAAGSSEHWRIWRLR